MSDLWALLAGSALLGPLISGPVVADHLGARLAAATPYLLVSLFGVLLGAAELLSRYRYEPRILSGTPEVHLYLGFNAAIGCAALYLLRVLDLDTATLADGEAGAAVVTAASTDILDVLIAGFGGAAFFRSAFARAKVGDVEVGIGPAFVIDQLLGYADRAIDRDQAMRRAQEMPGLMSGVPPDFAATSLTRFCISAMQNYAAAEKEGLGQRIAQILTLELKPYSPPMRAILIGMELSAAFGPGVLKTAIDSLKDEIAKAAAALARTAAATSEADLLQGLDAPEDDAAGPDVAPPADAAAGRPADRRESPVAALAAAPASSPPAPDDDSAVTPPVRAAAKGA